MAKYTIEAIGTNGCSGAFNDRPVGREHVRGWALSLAYGYAKYEGAIIRVRKGHVGGEVVSTYRAVAGVWTHVKGTEIRGLAGLDGAGCYMTKYPLAHVTREYAEFMAG